MRVAFLVAVMAVAALAGATFAGCGGAPPNNDNLGFTARCNDGTLTTACPETCVGNGGVDETFIGCGAILQPR